MSQKLIDTENTSTTKLIDFLVEWDFVEILDKIDPLVDRNCHYLDGRCVCKSIDDCKYLKDRL